MMLTMPNPPASEDEGGIDLSAIWNAFRRRWFIAISLGLMLGIPAAIGMWFVAPAPYVTFAELRLNSINSQSLPGSTSSKPVANFDIFKQAVLKRATHPLVLKEALREQSVRTASMIREQEPHESAWLEEHLAVKSVGTEYIRIELEGEQPKELATVVNAVAKAVAEDVDKDLHKEMIKRRQNLDALVTEVSSTITTKTNDLENMRSALKVDPAEIDRRRSYLVELAASLRSALVTIQVERLKLQAQQSPASNDNSGSKSQIDRLVEKIADGHPKYQRAAEDVSAQKKRVETQEKFVRRQTDELDATHPSLVEAEEQLVKYKKELEELTKNEATVRAEIKQELLKSLPAGAEAELNEDEYLKKHQKVFEEAFDENKKKLQVELDEIKAETQDLEKYSLKGSRITREIEREQSRLERFQDELERLKFEAENAPKLIASSREAEVPHTRSLKKKVMLSSVAGLGGFGFFVAGIVFLEYRTQRIATINQVSEKLNLRVMGTVPMLPRSATSGTTVKKKAKNSLWYSALTEAVDSTRTLLIRGSQIESLKTVMVASAVGGEGKTTMASHLATSLARGGRKILLIDCDLRRPCMHRAFDLPMSKGVCEILRGEATVADCIQELESPHGLSVLPAGKINQQVLKLLALDTLAEMLEPLKAQYDFIVIDSSPLLPVTDGLLVAQHVDGVILSIRRDVSRISKVMMACQKLSMLGIPLLGAVTIGLKEDTGYQSKYGYNYYAYGHRQHYYQTPPPA